ncbi:MAG: hypothetical protein FJ102_09025 [Deltaproteobacteria bacterium]|nr:hypothetical protein [Deltaproteobacteria bacterium]
MILLGLALAADVDFPRDHDLFVVEAGQGAHFRMTAFTPVTTPVRIDPAASPDALHVDGVETIDVNATGRVLYIATAGYGGIDSKGVAAEGEVVYADGRTQSLRWLVGEHAWPVWAGATGRLTDPLPLGTNVAGNTMMASLRVVPLSFPDTEVSRLVLRPRGGLDLYLLAVAMGEEWPPGHSDPVAAAPEGYPFAVPLGIDLGRFAPPGLPSAPIGAEGAIVAVGEKLVRRDSSEARLWGINLVGSLPAPEVARGLAARGFDLVRLHHVDTTALLASPDRAAGLARAEMLDRLDRFHAALRAQGIYQWLSIWTQLAPVAADGVDGPEGLPVGHKYAAMMWPSWREFQKRWFTAVWGRENPYTGQRYADDPAIAVVELSNEDGLLIGWQSGALEKLPAVHRRRLDELWIGFLRQKYRSDAALVAAWQGGNRPGLQDGETLAIGYVAREPSSRARTELFPARRAADLVAFYAALERDYFAEMSAFVRAEGFTAPIVCSNSLGIVHADAQLGACDVVDVHAYWDPIAESTAYYDASLLDPSARWLERLASCQAGRPCTVSELNHTWPNRFGQEAPLTWAALGGRQGWSALAWFAWSHAEIRDLPDGPGGALDLEGRFSGDVQMPAAGAIFRQLGAATARFTRAWTAGALERDLAEPSSLFLPETVGIPSYLARRVRSSFDGAMQRGGVDVSPVRWSRGRLVVDTPRAAAIVGSTTPTIEAPDPAILRASVGGHPAISLVMAASSPGRWLLTVAGRTDREGSWASPGVPGLLALGSGPARLQRLSGFVDIRVHARARVYALNPDGSPRERVRARRLPGGWWRVDIDADTPWFGVTTVPGD